MTPQKVCNECKKHKPSSGGKFGYDSFREWYCSDCWKRWESDHKDDTKRNSKSAEVDAMCMECRSRKPRCRPGWGQFGTSYYCDSCWDAFENRRRQEERDKEAKRKEEYEAEQAAKEEQRKAKEEEQRKKREAEVQRRFEEQRRKADELAKKQKEESERKVKELKLMEDERKEREERQRKVFEERKRVAELAWKESEQAEQIVEVAEEINPDPSSRHRATVILLNGFDADGRQWAAFRWAFERSGYHKSVRWVALNPPSRPQNRAKKQPDELPSCFLRSWFDYERVRLPAANNSDKVNDVGQLQAMRRALHQLIQLEADRLPQDSGSIVLVGQSQGGSMALDAALTLNEPHICNMIAGILIMRSCALDSTVTQLSSQAKRYVRKKPMPVVAVCGNQDQYYTLPLVRKQLELLPGYVVAAETLLIAGLDHVIWYDWREIREFVKFLVFKLDLQSSEEESEFDPESFSECLKPWASRWVDLTQTQRVEAMKLGIHDPNAWDYREACIWRESWHSLTPTKKAALNHLGITGDAMWKKINIQFMAFPQASRIVSENGKRSGNVDSPNKVSVNDKAYDSDTVIQPQPGIAGGS